MSERINAPHVGAPDPERRNSPVMEENSEDFAAQGQPASDTPLCYFNDVGYAHDSFVCSGDELLHCRLGVWVSQGSCDPGHP